MLLLPLTLYLFLDFVSCSLTTDYYGNLISQESAAALVYELPQSNEEFRTGANSNITNDFGTYDFVIVGAGSAGSVLATRLSEISEFKILLLEAGGEEDDFSNIPAMALNLQFSERNWGYFSTPQKHCCLGMVNQSCIIPRGKLIGGSSAINALMYVRGNRKDYDKWEQLGNPGWSYKHVLPYFIKSENSEIDGDCGFHGKGGLWNVEYSIPAAEQFLNFIEGSEELNKPRLDYNGRNQIGSAQTQFSIKYGRRQSTGTAFLAGARKRKNLHVKTKALVTKVNIDPRKKEAQGVEFVLENKKFRVIARKEVILSGGAINSPQLLLLSGIGPKHHLEEIGIKVIADLPVGKHLLEHPLFPGIIFHTNSTAPTLSTEETIEQYLHGVGPLTRAIGIEGLGFTHTGKTPGEVPTIEYIFVPPTGSAATILARVLNFNTNLVDNFLGQVNATTDIIIFLSLLHEKSRGQITLKSADPIDFPNIDLNLFAEQADVDTMTEGIQFLLKLEKTEAFRKINATRLDIPVCTEFSKDSKQYWNCVIRQMTATIYHPCGTTAMGPDRRTSVVDSNLKVHGIKSLRVVDAGVFPSTVSGHTNAPAVMVAEKIADHIKKEYGHLTQCA